MRSSAKLDVHARDKGRWRRVEIPHCKEIRDPVSRVSEGPPGMRQEHGGQTYPIVLISACAPSTINAFGHHSVLAASAFLVNSIFSVEKLTCLFLLVIMNVIGIPFRNLLNTITVYKENCKTGM
jgi:hypothetical protein